MAKNQLTEEQLALLNDSFPVVSGDNRISLPRLGMLSKDIVEESGTGKAKKIKVVEAAGTFYKEKDSGKEEGWEKEFTEGESIEGIIVFHRKQLKYFDKGLEKFISSPVFDTDDQIIPLFLDKRVIARGTKDELQAKYPALTQKGKKTSDLKEYKILYVLFEGELYQMNLTTSSGWAFSKYAKSFGGVGSPASVVTSLSSIEETNGSNTYRKITFTNVRGINAEEFDLVKEKQGLVRESSESDKKFLSSQAQALPDGDAEAEKEFAGR